ncbi:MAG: polyprenyl diphosphate synthase [Patescibacteria group bacterium]
MLSDIKNISSIPKHVAIIMDGNRRWAREKGFPSLEGHRKGADNFEKLAEKAKELGVLCFTGWAFSTENWKRSKQEVKYLFSLIEELAGRYKKKCQEKKTKFIHIGRKDRIPERTKAVIEDVEDSTKDFNDFTVAMGIDYGGHDEMLRVMEKIKEKGEEITPENIEKNLDTASLPQIDLIIRTGGEKRLSGFMSWQCAYAELYFTDTYFPDFGPKQLEEAIRDFSQRERRFGGN